jgi:hypothetical protein
MNTTALGLITGLILGLTAAFGGFSQFLIVVIFGALGLAVARLIEGKLDLSALTGRARARK